MASGPDTRSLGSRTANPVETGVYFGAQRNTRLASPVRWLTSRAIVIIIIIIWAVRICGAETTRMGYGKGYGERETMRRDGERAEIRRTSGNTENERGDGERERRRSMEARPTGEKRWITEQTEIY